MGHRRCGGFAGEFEPVGGGARHRQDRRGALADRQPRRVGRSVLQGPRPLARAGQRARRPGRPADRVRRLRRPLRPRHLGAPLRAADHQRQRQLRRLLARLGDRRGRLGRRRKAQDRDDQRRRRGRGDPGARLPVRVPDGSPNFILCRRRAAPDQEIQRQDDGHRFARLRRRARHRQGAARHRREERRAGRARRVLPLRYRRLLVADRQGPAVAARSLGRPALSERGDRDGQAVPCRQLQPEILRRQRRPRRTTSSSRPARRPSTRSACRSTSPRCALPATPSS